MKQIKHIKSILISVSLLLLLAGCGCGPCGSCGPDSCIRPYCIAGPDEFVADSYKIQEGKMAILELMGIEVAEMPCDAMDEFKDEIDEDDVLNIIVYHPSRKDLMDSFDFINKNVGGFRVTKGYVDLPDIEPVYVAGLTLDDARALLQSKLREHIENAEIFVTYKDRERRRVELAGQVGKEYIPVDGKIRLYEVIAKAKIAQSANLFMSYILRDGKQLPIDLHALMNEGNLDYNIVMQGGDKVYLAHANDAVVMVMGEVGNPSAIALNYGYMTLPEAIVLAKGIPFTGNRDNIHIIRGDMQCPKVYCLSWRHIIHLPNSSMLLMPGDTVYVSEKPITQWNRFISQLLPSVQYVKEFRGAFPEVVSIN